MTRGHPVTRKENTDKGKFFKQNVGCYNVRGHDYKLYKSKSRLNVRKIFFSQWVVDIWNSRSNHVVEAESVNSFKGKLDKCKERAIKSSAPWARRLQVQDKYKYLR